jgi:hypothetical protein
LHFVGRYHRTLVFEAAAAAAAPSSASCLFRETDAQDFHWGSVLIVFVLSRNRQGTWCCRCQLQEI